MGSLFSTPDVPTSFNPYTYVPPAPTVSTPTTGDNTTDTNTDTDNGDKDRVAAIVRRRSFPDTIQTSWRGVLQTGEWMPQRKSLLGE